METMFDKILQLPLFQGICRNDLTSILERVKFSFDRVGSGETVVHAGTPCVQLSFLLKGELEMVSHGPENSFTVYEKYTAPYLIEPYRLFGMETVYQADYVALTECHMVHIKKQDVLDELFRYDIFRLNYANIACNRSQYLYDKLWMCTPVDVERKIILFFLNHMDRLQGEKRFSIKMVDLARHLGNTRLNVSKVLNALAEQGLIGLHRKEIVIADPKLLLEYLSADV